MTALEVVRHESAQLEMTRDQLDLLKATICRDATDDEFKLFVNTCKRLRLDPFARQIFAVKRWDSQASKNVMGIQVSVDGARLVAERTGEYEGQPPTQWCGPDGKWVDVWLDDAPPAAARVGVYRKGFREALYSVATYRSYVQTKKEGGANKMWASMPDVMLAKCAESLSLRKAFPNELSGVYTMEEMGQADNHAQSERHAPVQQKPQALTAMPEVITMSEIMTKIYGAKTEQDLQGVAKLAQYLPDDEKEMVRVDYKNRLDEIRGVKEAQI